MSPVLALLIGEKVKKSIPRLKEFIHPPLARRNRCVSIVVFPAVAPLPFTLMVKPGKVTLSGWETPSKSTNSVVWTFIPCPCPFAPVEDSIFEPSCRVKPRPRILYLSHLAGLSHVLEC